MRLTREANGDRVDRFAYLEPAGLITRKCGTALAGIGTRHRCTRPADHRGPHVAHGLGGRVMAVWEPATGVGLEPSREARQTPLETLRDRAPRRGTDVKSPSAGHAPMGALAPVGRLLRKVLSSPEELAMTLLFLGLVAWGVSVAWAIVTRW